MLAISIGPEFGKKSAVLLISLLVLRRNTDYGVGQIVSSSQPATRQA